MQAQAVLGAAASGVPDPRATAWGRMLRETAGAEVAEVREHSTLCTADLCSESGCTGAGGTWMPDGSDSCSCDCEADASPGTAVGSQSHCSCW